MDKIEIGSKVRTNLPYADIMLGGEIAEVVGYKHNGYTCKFNRGNILYIKAEEIVEVF